MRLGVRAALVDGLMVPGDVEIVDGRVVAVGVSPAGSHGLAVPGFVEVQTNGFAGVDFNATDVEGYRAVSAALPATGVTCYQPTLISQPVEGLVAGVTTIGEARTAGLSGARILGAHLEAPFLSPDHPGAHDPRFALDPDLALADRLCDTGPVTHVTLAPERPGGLELVAHLVARGVRVSLGHSGADAPTAHAAFNRGACAVTHLHNAMHRFTHRDPGLPGVAMIRDDVTVTVIVDHIHLAPETTRLALLAAPGRLALITDQIAAAGRGPGTFPLGDRTVTVTEVDARLTDGTLAGSVLTMDRAVRNLVEVGATLVEAVAGASAVPARLVGRPELGTLRPGTPADVVVLDEDVAVARTLVAGEERFAA
jgi:N-acetylglucosamine-6-phosphate deacetylase